MKEYIKPIAIIKRYNISDDTNFIKISANYGNTNGTTLNDNGVIELNY